MIVDPYTVGLDERAERVLRTILWSLPEFFPYDGYRNGPAAVPMPALWQDYGDQA